MILSLLCLALGMTTGVFVCLAYTYPTQFRVHLGLAAIPLLCTVCYEGYRWLWNIPSPDALRLFGIAAYVVVSVFLCASLWYRFMTRAKQGTEPETEDELGIRYGVLDSPAMTHQRAIITGLPVSLPITMQPLLPNQRWFIDVPKTVTGFTLYHIETLHAEHGTFWEVAASQDSAFIRYVSPPAPATGRELERYTVSLKGTDA